MDAIASYSGAIVAEFRPTKNRAKDVWTDRYSDPGYVPEQLAGVMYDRIWDDVRVADTTLKCLKGRYLFGSSEVWLIGDDGMRQSERAITYVEVPDEVNGEARTAMTQSQSSCDIVTVAGTAFLVEETNVKTDVSIGSKDPVNADEVRVKGERAEFNLG